jgi:hypothetical protein
MRGSQSIDGPSAFFLVSNQRSNANDRVIDVLREFVAHGRANLVIALAVMALAAAKLLISGTVSMSQTMTLATITTFNRLAAHESTRRGRRFAAAGLAASRYSAIFDPCADVSFRAVGLFDMQSSRA